MAEFAATPMTLLGPGSLAELPAKLNRLDVHRALVITDRGLIDAGIAPRVVEALATAGITSTVYADVTPNPTIEEVEAAVALFRASSSDVLVAVGGGSANDCAKAVRARLAGMSELTDTSAPKQMPRRGVVFVAVNTTAGTGSEVSRAYLITDTAAQRKLIFKDDFAMPDIAVDDCDLMMGLPAALTAWTGMDALTHAVEAFVSTRHSLLTDTLALDAIRLTAQYLPRAVASGGDEEARDGMATAQYLAGLAFGSAGLGLVHAMAHQFGALYDAPHGLANAVVLPEVMAFYLDVCPDRLAKVAVALGAATADAAERPAAWAAVSHVRRMLAELGIDRNALVASYQPCDLPRLVRQALEDGCIATSPKLPDASEVEALFNKVVASSATAGA